MKTDELVISEEYRYYVTREGKLAVLMCDLTKVPVDVPFEPLNGTDCLIFFHESIDQTREHYQNGRYYKEGASELDVVGCLYFAGGYQEANLELKSGLCRKFVCCDESDVIGAVFDPKKGTCQTWGVQENSWSEPSHSLAGSIAKSIASGDGKWLEATAQSLQLRREAVQRRIDERDEYPQYWTTNTTVETNIAFVIRTSPQEWHIVKKDGSRTNRTFPWNANYRERITKEQAEALLDKKTSEEPKTRLRSIPTNERLFEMVANLRDQMDHLNRKVEQMCEKKA